MVQIDHIEKIYKTKHLQKNTLHREIKLSQMILLKDACNKNKILYSLILKTYRIYHLEKIVAETDNFSRLIL